MAFTRLRRPFTLILCLVLAACQTSSAYNHVWVTDLAAKDVVDTDFPLKGRTQIGAITQTAENAPANAERAIKLSFRSNGFVAPSAEQARYRLDVSILEVTHSAAPQTPETRKLIEDLSISDDADIVLNRYFLIDASSETVVRDMTVLTVYDPTYFDDGILISCTTCLAENLPQSGNTGSGNAVALSPEFGSNPRNEPASSPLYYRPITKEAKVSGAVATILVVGLLTGGRVIPQFYGGNFSGSSPPYGTQKYGHSIRKGRAFKNNLHGASEVLSKEPL